MSTYCPTKISASIITKSGTPPHFIRTIHFESPSHVFSFVIDRSKHKIIGKIFVYLNNISQS